MRAYPQGRSDPPEQDGQGIDEAASACPGASSSATITTAGCSSHRHDPRASIGKGYVDFKLVSDDAIYPDDEGTEHVLQWVTQLAVDLARRISEIAADHQLEADPASVSDIELGLDAALCDHRPRVGRPADRKRPGPRPWVPQ